MSSSPSNGYLLIQLQDYHTYADHLEIYLVVTVAVLHWIYWPSAWAWYNFSLYKIKCKYCF